MSKEKERKSNEEDSGPDWHEGVIAGIHPRDERNLLRKTRQRVKNTHGFSDELLDKLYGVNSR